MAPVRGKGVDATALIDLDLGRNEQLIDHFGMPEMQGEAHRTDILARS